MNNSTHTLEELMEIDEAIAEMKRHPIDYSDIPPMKPGAKVRMPDKAWLDSQPREVVLELGRQRLKQMGGDRQSMLRHEPTPGVTS